MHISMVLCACKQHTPRKKIMDRPNTLSICDRIRQATNARDLVLLGHELESYEFCSGKTRRKARRLILDTAQRLGFTSLPQLMKAAQKEVLDA